jgi:hemoglobin
MTTEALAKERRAELAAELASHSMYELLGGEVGLRTLVDRFYELMDDDASYKLIRDMHKGDLAPVRELLFEYLSGWLGGPALFIDRRGGPCLTGAHAPYRIDAEARDLWVACMCRTMEDVGIAQRYREALTPALEGIADTVRNVG